MTRLEMPVLRMRSKLFVPASRPELFDKAMRSEADALSFDLEDAVEESRKGEARQLLADFFASLPPENTRQMLVRVNGVRTAHFDQDMAMVVAGRAQVVNVPMLESGDDVVHAAQTLARLERETGRSAPVGILANIESPRALRFVAEIALAHPRVIGLQIGFGDLFSPYGIDSRDEAAAQSVRLAVRLAAAEAGIAAYDGAFVNIADPEGFRADAMAALRMGFSGKSCIHPTQIALANEVFRPTDAQIAHAVKVVEAARDALGRGVGAFVVDGKLVDGPFIAEAQRILSIAGWPAVDAQRRE